MDGDTLYLLDGGKGLGRINDIGVAAPEREQSFDNKARNRVAGRIVGNDVDGL